MAVIAWGIGFTHPKGAIGDTSINAVVHIHVFTFFPIFGTRNPSRLIGRWQSRQGGQRRRIGGFVCRGLRVTHGIYHGVSAFGGVLVHQIVPRRISVNCPHRTFVGRSTMGVRRCRLVSSVDMFGRFSPQNVRIDQGKDMLRLQTRPSLLHLHGVAVVVRLTPRWVCNDRDCIGAL